MSENVQSESSDLNEEERKEVAKNALIFALLFLLMVVALWGYVYVTMLGRGLTQ